jgi:hypothetical protein
VASLVIMVVAGVGVVVNDRPRCRSRATAAVIPTGAARSCTGADAPRTLAVLLGGMVIAVTGSVWVDPMLSLRGGAGLTASRARTGTRRRRGAAVRSIPVTSAAIC